MTAPSKASRYTGRPRSPSDSASSQASEGPLQREHRAGGNKFPSSIRPTKTPSHAVCDNDTSPEDGDDEEGEDEDDDSDEDEIAPSAAPKRGHQTGLSISLSNASLGKRGRSPASDGAEDRPMSKRSKTDGEGETSDDDAAYNAVDEISDSEEEGEGDVEQVEEQAIIHDEDEDFPSLHEKHGSFSSLGSFGGAALDADVDLLFAETGTFFDDGLADVLRHNSFTGDDTEGGAPVRKVRFAEEVLAREARGESSSTTESEDETPIYPDLFVQQSSLDPSFRKLLERNNEGSVSDGEGSYWDYENENRVEELDDNDDDSESGSSGYETDEGETTDEDFNVPQTVKPDRGLLRFDNYGNARPKVTPATTPMKRALAVARKGPTMGSFIVDEDKPIAVIDGHGKNMLIFPAPKHRRTQEGSASQFGSPGPSSSLLSAIPQSDTESDVGFTQVDPMLSSPANTMVSGFNCGRPGRSASNLSNEILGPEEAFFPFVSLNNDGSFDAGDHDIFDDDLFSDADLNLEDFINFDDGSSGDDNKPAGGNEDDPSSNNTTGEEDTEKTPQPTSKFTAVKPRVPSTPTPSVPGSLLDHFDRGVASSFRRNADRHKNWTRSPIAAGIKGGRFEIANSPISPMRRRKGMPATPSSQLQRMQPPQAPASATKSSPQQFGGPLKKRIQNSEGIQRLIQRQRLRKRKDSF